MQETHAHRSRESFDDETYCQNCGSMIFVEDCWKCGGEGGTPGEELMMEDPFWYSPDDFRICDECDGTGIIEICVNPDCDN